MGAYTITETKSKIVFYTTKNAAFFVNCGITYQIVYVDQGRKGHRFASLKRVIRRIESGEIQGISELAAAMKKDVNNKLTWQHSQRKPWMENVARV